ncbi:MAG: acyl-CoA thioesterase [Anaerolineales bacterium]|jgi:acyl-CoA thioester hydrolase
MPHTFTAHFTVRHDECDAYGHLNNAVYLRYMQEAAFRASADAGLGQAEYEAMGHFWLIRETEIEYLQPVKGGDDLAITTWNEGFRRTMAHRHYQFTRPGSEKPVADAWTDWVFLNRQTMHPATIPPGIHSAYFPECSRAPGFTRLPFPDVPSPPTGVFKLVRRVEWRDIDEMQHLNNAAYLSYVEDCAVQLADHFGWSFDQWSEHNQAFVARRHRIQYLQPVLLEDQLEIRTWLFNVRRTSATRYYGIHRASDGELMSQVATLWALIDLESGRPTRFPESFHEIIGPNIADG